MNKLTLKDFFSSLEELDEFLLFYDLLTIRDGVLRIWYCDYINLKGTIIRGKRLIRSIFPVNFKEQLINEIIEKKTRKRH